MIDNSILGKLNYPKIRAIEEEHLFGDEISNFVLRPSASSLSNTPTGHLRMARKWNSMRKGMTASLSLDPEQIRQNQLLSLSKLVDHAYKYLPFYRKLFDKVGFQVGAIGSFDDFKHLPVINKSVMLDNIDLIMQGLTGPISEYHTSRTSGSSGIAFTTIQDDPAMDLRMLYYIRHCEMMIGEELSAQDWRYNIYLAADPYTTLAGDYPMVSVSPDCPPEIVAQHLSLIRPKLLLTLPSYLRRLSGVCSDLRSFGVKAICTNSEASTPGERSAYAEHFGVPVLDEYSSVEVCLIATECREGKYHIAEDNVYAECINVDESGVGNQIVTGLHNFAMPFIRYDQGDLTKINDFAGKCGCGSTFRTIEVFQGRSDQQLTSKIIGKVAADKLMMLYDRTLIEARSGVSEFQIVQDSINHINLNLTPLNSNKSVNTLVVDEFISGLRDLFQDYDLEVSVNVYKKMPREKSYKRRLIINKIE